MFLRSLCVKKAALVQSMECGYQQLQAAMAGQWGQTYNIGNSSNYTSTNIESGSEHTLTNTNSCSKHGPTQIFIQNKDEHRKMLKTRTYTDIYSEQRRTQKNAQNSDLHRYLFKTQKIAETPAPHSLGKYF